MPGNVNGVLNNVELQNVMNVQSHRNIVLMDPSFIVNTPSTAS